MNELSQTQIPTSPEPQLVNTPTPSAPIETPKSSKKSLWLIFALIFIVVVSIGGYISYQYLKPTASTTQLTSLPEQETAVKPAPSFVPKTIQSKDPKVIQEQIKQQLQSAFGE